MNHVHCSSDDVHAVKLAGLQARYVTQQVGWQLLMRMVRKNLFKTPGDLGVVFEDIITGLA
jgi:hypothetical protein